jgi:decaprenylphospho-beta-D-ribofuranose 2-oxidase
MEPEENQTFRSFGRGAAGVSVAAKPTTLYEVRSVFETARKSGQRVAIRAGGHSFHDQALHDGDTGRQIVMSTEGFNEITFAPGGDPNTVRIGAGVKWIDYFYAALKRVQKYAEPLRLPGSMQTGRQATAGGTMSGDCLSRFSGVLGKESRWIQSFRILTTKGDLLDVNSTNNPALFNAVIGGHGYLGFVTDVTYKLIAIDSASCARTRIETYETFRELVDAQLRIINTTIEAPPPLAPRAVSSVWFTDLADIGQPDKIKGGVFDSVYASKSSPPTAGFPLYSDIDSGWRYGVELMARVPLVNLLIHEFLYNFAKEQKVFENDLMDFLFFMDGNTAAKYRFEREFYPQLFPIVQQTFVVPAEQAADFAANCERKMSLRFLRPTEADMLFVAQDECLLSANYHLDGFAVSLAFEPIAPSGKAPPEIVALLYELSKDCISVGGRIHFVKNMYIEPADFRTMFSPQLEQFEDIKLEYDPDLILQNSFSDRFFLFRKKGPAFPVR